MASGELWEKGFVTGLISSACFLPVLSRGALQNFESLESKSPCDNVLLEYRLGLELHQRRLVEKIYPLFIGEKNPTTNLYSKYSFVGHEASHPQHMRNEQVVSVEVKLREHLRNCGMGLPLDDDFTTPQVLQNICKYQGAFVTGDLESSLKATVRDVCSLFQSNYSI